MPNCEQNTSANPSSFFLNNKKYKVLKKLGKGAYGYAYLVQNSEGKQRVIKDFIKDPQIDPRYFILTPGAQVNGTVEGLALQQLFMGNQYKGRDESNPSERNRWLIKMKYIPGDSYKNFLNKVTQNKFLINSKDHILDVLELAFPAAVQQVIYYHAMGIQHNDYNPNNLNIWKRGGTYSIAPLDFGLANISSPCMVRWPLVGTPGFVNTKGVYQYNEPNPHSGYRDVFSLALCLKLHLARMSVNDFYMACRAKYRLNNLACDLGKTSPFRIFDATRAYITELTPLSPSASKEEIELARLLNIVINRGESQLALNPREFLDMLIQLYDSSECNFPQITYLERAKEIIRLSDRAIKQSFINGNKKLKKLNQKIKQERELVQRLDITDAVNELLKTIQKTLPFDRTEYLAKDLTNKYERLKRQSQHHPLRNAVTLGIQRYLEFIHSLTYGNQPYPDDSTISSVSLDLDVFSRAKQWYKDSRSNVCTVKNLRDNKPLGFFTRIRHGQDGFSEAKRLRWDISICRSEEEIMRELGTFFHKKNRRYHKHSLSSFILDALNEYNPDMLRDNVLDTEKNEYISASVKATF